MNHRVEYVRVKVWSLPIILFHWINFTCIVILVVTGFLIANPIHAYGASPSTGNANGMVRLIHFTTAYIFILNFLFRIIWGFFDKKYGRWSHILPFSKKKLRELWLIIKYEVLLMKEEEPYISVGHNALASVFYLILFLSYAVQIWTGALLMTGTSESILTKLVWWTLPLFGNLINVRMIHHLITWWIIIFTMFHLYKTLFVDYVKERGVVSAMIGGYKFLRSDEIEKG